MATYRALKDVSGKTAFNGVYPFSIKQGELVEADKAGGSWLNIKLPGAAPTPQQYAPIAKIPGTNFELIAAAPGSAAVPVTTQTKAPAVPAALAKEGSKFMSNLWIPVVGANVGMLAGTYFAWHKGSGTWGFIGWSSLGSIAGLLLAVPIVVVRVKSQGESIGKKLNSASAGTSTASSGNLAQMKAAIVEENVKAGMDKAATEEYVNKLTEKEIQSLYLTVKMPDKQALMKQFPEFFKTPPANQEEGEKIMGQVIEKLQGQYGVSGLTGPEFIAATKSAMVKMFAG